MKEKISTASATMTRLDKECLAFDLSGTLDIHSTAQIWQQCINAQEKFKPKQIIINAEKLEYCDGAGLALLSELKARQTAINQTCEINNLLPRLQKLLDMIVRKEPVFSKAITKIRFSDRMLMKFGFLAVGVAGYARDDIKFIGKICYEFFQSVFHPRSLRWKDVWKTMQLVGPDALPIVALLGLLIGFISAFQSAIPLGKFGAQIYIGSLVGISLVREMGPLITAVILAGRTASSFAAEMGTMKINQEIDALTTMGIDPVKFLILPRIIATTLMTPLLNIFLIFFGLVGCGIVMHILGFSHELFLQQLQGIITVQDVIGSLIKATTFGMLIATIGCFHGIKTNFGASAVGKSTTQAVVAAIIMIVFVDGIFAAVFYALGI